MENEEREKLELVTEAIFSLLYHQGDMDLQTLKEKANIPEHVFDMAIGALVDKGDVELIPNGNSFTAHRTDPAPALFPFRSN